MAITTEQAIDILNLVQSVTKTDIITLGSPLFKSYGDKLDAIFIAITTQAYGTDEEKAHFFYKVLMLAKEIQQEVDDWKDISFLFGTDETKSIQLLSLIKSVHKNTMIGENELDNYIKTLQDIFA